MPSGKQVPLDEEGSEVFELAEQGFYELRSRSGDGVAAVVASNVDSTESDLTGMDPKEIVAAARATDDGARPGTAGVPLPPDAQERSQRLWWYLLVLGILVLGADTLISNRLSKS